MLFALSFAFLASFADQKRYPPSVEFMVRVQFQPPDQTARNDVDEACSEVPSLVVVGLLLAAIQAATHQQRLGVGRTATEVGEQRHCIFSTAA